MIVNKCFRRFFLSSSQRKGVNYAISSVLKRDAYTKSPQKKAANTIAVPEAAVNQKEKQSYEKYSSNQTDIYGEVDPASNIPNIKFFIPENETAKEKKFREFKQDLVCWHQRFWLAHNKSFRKGKKTYLDQRENQNTVSDEKMQADELSVFYKDFLDRNFNIHFNYQREWYKRNLQCFWYGLQVQFEKLVKTKKIHTKK